MSSTPADHPKAASSTPSTPAYHPKHLCFAEQEVELGFIRLRYAKLANTAFLGFSMFLFFIVAYILLMVLGGWQTGGGIYVDSKEASKVVRARFVLILSLALLSVTGMAAAKSSRVRACLGPRRFELFMSFLACAVTVAIPFLNIWYMARACGVADPSTVLANIGVDSPDDNIMLNLDIWLTGWHMMVPIRWVMFWPMELTVILAYLIPAIWIGPMPLQFVIQNVVIMSMLIGGTAFGKRALEINERLAFISVATERTLRCQAEHQLSEVVQQSQEGGTGIARCDAETWSLPTSSPTAELFDIGAGNLSTEEQLKRLTDVGLQEHWLIKPEACQPCPGPPLGSGGFGMVLVALYHGVEVVLKVARMSRDRATVKTLLSTAGELRILRRLRHPNIVTFYGACIDPGSSEIFLVLEYVRGITLTKSVRDVPTTPDEIVDRVGLANDVCCALMYLHAQTPMVIHGDIKGANVLVEQQVARRTAKLLDFGLSKLLTRHARDLGGTYPWMAPEVLLRDESALAPSADVFSFGRLLYKIMTGRSPLSGVSREELVAIARRGECPSLEWPEEETTLFSAARQLCEECTEFDPAGRISISKARDRLYHWGDRPDFPERVASALRAALPRRPIAGGRLQETIANARNASLSSGSGATGPPPELVQHRSHHARRRNGRSDRRLIAPHLAETPDRTKLMSIGLTLCMWNVPLEAGCCCDKHALQNELQRLLNKLHTMACRDLFQDGDRWQCPGCAALIPAASSEGLDNSDVGQDCPVCDNKVTSPGRTIGTTLQGVVEEEDEHIQDDDHAAGAANGAATTVAL